MTQMAEIIRLAAKGDGVTARGEHFARTVPGDRVNEAGEVTRGAHHVDPPCRHFGECGGCQLQHADDAVLSEFVRGRVVNAAAGQGLLEEGASSEKAGAQILEEHLSPANSRRRASFHAQRTQAGAKNGRMKGGQGKSRTAKVGRAKDARSAGGAALGFREAGSHRVVDLAECSILRPELARLIAPLREFVAMYGPKGSVDIAMTLCDQGADLGFVNFPLEGLAATEAALEFARDHALARLSVDQGYGAETLWEPEPATITLSGLPVSLPAGSFLQATQDAEALLTKDAADWIGDARLVADLFSGLGTFAFALAAKSVEGRKVLAVEAEQAAHLACKSAASRTGGRVLALHRDLFRNPLQASELNKFDAVLLDPPRAGAKSQIGEIAASDIKRVLYVSCNPSSWARDGAVLAEAGFELTKLRPVGQFRWSTHVELISLFERRS